MEFLLVSLALPKDAQLCAMNLKFARCLHEKYNESRRLDKRDSE